MTHPDALARLHRIAGAHAGHSDPYIRAVLPPVPLEWATPAERQEWREMVVALTNAPNLPDVGIPAAVWQHARAVADTTPTTEPGEHDDADRVPAVPMNVEGTLSAQDGRQVEPHDLDFYDDEEWALSVGKPWHAYRCTHNYFRHPKPEQTGDCDPWRRIPCPLI